MAWTHKMWQFQDYNTGKKQISEFMKDLNSLQYITSSVILGEAYYSDDDPKLQVSGVIYNDNPTQLPFDESKIEITNIEFSAYGGILFWDYPTMFENTTDFLNSLDESVAQYAKICYQSGNLSTEGINIYYQK